jgi:hypothetical protein
MGIMICPGCRCPNTIPDPSMQPRCFACGSCSLDLTQFLSPAAPTISPSAPVAEPVNSTEQV